MKTRRLVYAEIERIAYVERTLRELLAMMRKLRCHKAAAQIAKAVESTESARRWATKQWQNPPPEPKKKRHKSWLHTGRPAEDYHRAAMEAFNHPGGKSIVEQAEELGIGGNLSEDEQIVKDMEQYEKDYGEKEYEPITPEAILERLKAKTKGDQE